MKFKYFALIAAILVIFPFAGAANATLIEYNNIDELSAVVANDPNYILDAPIQTKILLNDSGGYEDEWLNFSYEGDITIVQNTISGLADLTFVYKQANTIFGADWVNYVSKKAEDVNTTSSFDVYTEGNALPTTFNIPTYYNQGKHFYGIRGDEGELITRVVVHLDGATLSNPVHNLPVPEPSTLLLLGSGALGLSIFRRKFRKK